MSPEQVLTVARQGAALGCKEALLTLGDRPEDRWPEARAWLDEHGYASTLDYVGAMARLITAETGLLAHLNPGVMTADELRMLRPTAPSMGMMLETTSRRLFEEPGQVHYGSPDKDPDLRLARDRGRRARARAVHHRHPGRHRRDAARPRRVARRAPRRAGAPRRDGVGHVQEVIVQNFRAKPRTAMQSAPDASRARVRRRGRRRPARDGPAHAHPGAAEPLGPRGVRAARARRRRRLGRGLAAHGRPRQPRAPLAAPVRPRRAHRRARVRAARAADRAARVRRRTPRRWIDPALRPPSRRSPTPQTGLRRGDAGEHDAGDERRTPETRRRHGDRRDRRAVLRARGAAALAEAAAADPLEPRRRRMGRAAAGDRRRPRRAHRRPPTTCAATRSARP